LLHSKHPQLLNGKRYDKKRKRKEKKAKFKWPKISERSSDFIVTYLSPFQSHVGLKEAISAFDTDSAKSSFNGRFNAKINNGISKNLWVVQCKPKTQDLFTARILFPSLQVLSIHSSPINVV